MVTLHGGKGWSIQNGTPSQSESGGEVDGCWFSVFAEGNGGVGVARDRCF